MKQLEQVTGIHVNIINDHIKSLLVLCPATKMFAKQIKRKQKSSNNPLVNQNV